MIRIILFLCALILSIHPAAADELISTSAKQAIVVDFDTGMVLYDKKPDERMPTSSMSKVMTIYKVFDELKKGDLKLDDKFTVSERAWRKGGSKMFIEVGKRVKVEDLVRGVVIQSGNDAAIALAEGIAGSEKIFAASITDMAHNIGMKDTHFANASGWPDPDHYSTARDLATLGMAMVRNFPEYYSYYSEKEFTYNDITQKNRNPLLYRDIGADGIKTGHTEVGGYGLIGSGTYDGRRVVLVLNGMASEKERAQESAKMLEWGLRRFENKTLFKAGDTVETLEVVMGQANTVPVSLKQDLQVTVPKISRNNLDITVHYKKPIEAPIAAGTQVATLRVDVPYVGSIERPLYTSEPVSRIGFFKETILKAKHVLLGGK